MSKFDDFENLTMNDCNKKQFNTKPLYMYFLLITGKENATHPVLRIS